MSGERAKRRGDRPYTRHHHSYFVRRARHDKFISSPRSTFIAGVIRIVRAIHGPGAMSAERTVERRIPRDAAVVINILRSMGVKEWEPRVVNQLMEFVHRASPPPAFRF